MAYNGILAPAPIDHTQRWSLTLSLQLVLKGFVLSFFLTPSHQIPEIRIYDHLVLIIFNILKKLILVFTNNITRSKLIKFDPTHS